MLKLTCSHGHHTKRLLVLSVAVVCCCPSERSLWVTNRQTTFSITLTSKFEKIGLLHCSTHEFHSISICNIALILNSNVETNHQTDRLLRHSNTTHTWHTTLYNKNISEYWLVIDSKCVSSIYCLLDCFVYLKVQTCCFPTLFRPKQFCKSFNKLKRFQFAAVYLVINNSTTMQRPFLKQLGTDSLQAATQLSDSPNVCCIYRHKHNPECYTKLASWNAETSKSLPACGVGRRRVTGIL